MFLITHRATGALAALLIAACGALSLGRAPATECAAPAEPAATTAALVRGHDAPPRPVLGSP